jgi:hypothetical protein
MRALPKRTGRKNGSSSLRFASGHREGIAAANSSPKTEQLIDSEPNHPKQETRASRSGPLLPLSTLLLAKGGSAKVSTAHHHPLSKTGDARRFGSGNWKITTELPGPGEVGRQPPKSGGWWRVALLWITISAVGSYFRELLSRSLSVSLCCSYIQPLFLSCVSRIEWFVLGQSAALC